MTRITALKVAAAALCLALTAAACGGNGNSPSVAGSGGSNSTTSSSTPPSSGGGTSSGGGSGGQATFKMLGGKDATKFASCMRQNGVPNFPDPSANGSITASGINPDSPAFQNAMKACAKYTPNGGRAPSPEQQARMQAQALKFSACMRSHGLTTFPDPQFSPGGMSIRIRGNSIDPNSPLFQSAQKACAKDLPGKPVPLGAGGAK
jgi:hypothetical protein